MILIDKIKIFETCYISEFMSDLMLGFMPKSSKTMPDYKAQLASKTGPNEECSVQKR